MKKTNHINKIWSSVHLLLDQLNKPQWKIWVNHLRLDKFITYIATWLDMWHIRNILSFNSISVNILYLQIIIVWTMYKWKDSMSKVKIKVRITKLVTWTLLLSLYIHFKFQVSILVRKIFKETYRHTTGCDKVISIKTHLIMYIGSIKICLRVSYEILPKRVIYLFDDLRVQSKYDNSRGSKHQSFLHL